MDAIKLYQTLKKAPFSPFRIHLSDGASYDITHPDQVFVTQRWSYVGLRGNGDGPFEDDACIDNLHVVRLEPLKRAGKPRKA